MTSMFSVDDFGRSFERHLRAMRKSPRTVKTYMEAVQLFSAFLDQHGGGRPLLEAKRADIEAFLVSLHERCTPATVANRYRSLRRFYGWLEEEEQIPVSPMAKMRPPAVPEQPVPVLPDDALQRLLAASAGKGFEARRDTAIVMVLIDAGPRLAEVAGMRVKDIGKPASTASRPGSATPSSTPGVPQSGNEPTTCASPAVPRHAVPLWCLHRRRPQRTVDYLLGIGCRTLYYLRDDPYRARR